MRLQKGMWKYKPAIGSALVNYRRSLKERNCKDSQLFRNTQLFAHKATGRVARVLRKSKIFGKYSVPRFTIQILFINL